jgi:hypothetical protein
MADDLGLLNKRKEIREKRQIIYNYFVSEAGEEEFEVVASRIKSYN